MVSIVRGRRRDRESACHLEAAAGLSEAAGGAGPSPAVVLLHGCSGNWGRLDQRWGKRIAAWGYVTLTVDSFGPRGIQNTCNSGLRLSWPSTPTARWFLVRQPFADPARIVVLGFSQGGWLALTSIERGAIERTSQNKFRAAIASIRLAADSKAT